MTAWVDRAFVAACAAYAVAIVVVIRVFPEPCSPGKYCGFAGFVYDFQILLGGTLALLGGSAVIGAALIQLRARAAERMQQDVSLGAGMLTEITSHAHTIAFAAQLLSSTADREALKTHFNEGFRFDLDQAQRIIALRLPDIWRDLYRINPKAIDPVRMQIQKLEFMYVQSQLLMEYWRRIAANDDADPGLYNTDAICYRIIGQFRSMNPPAQALTRWVPARGGNLKRYQASLTGGTAPDTALDPIAPTMPDRSGGL